MSSQNPMTSQQPMAMHWLIDRLLVLCIVLVLAGTCATLSAAGFDRVGESVGLAALVAGLAAAWWRG